MPKKRPRLAKNRFLFVLLALLIELVIYPFLNQAGIIGNTILALAATLVVVATVYMVSHERKRLIVALALGIPFVAVSWINSITDHPVAVSLTALLSLAFYGFAIAIILDFIGKTERVTLNTIFGAISVYLLLGITWVPLYGLVLNFAPGSFANANSVSDLLYYSFITLTSVGDGQVLPVSSFARSLTILEAVFGVLYIATLIGLLVGAYSMEVTADRVATKRAKGEKKAGGETERKAG